MRVLRGLLLMPQDDKQIEGDDNFQLSRSGVIFGVMIMNEILRSPNRLKMSARENYFQLVVVHRLTKARRYVQTSPVARRHID